MTTVWLLGAGASASSSNNRVPVTADVLRKAKELKIVTDLEIRLEFAQLNEYVRQLLGADLLDLSVFNPEYTLSLLDIDLAVSPNPKLHEARRQLLEFIRRVIDRTQRDVPSGTSEYDKLVDRLDPHDSILTLNWDLTLDRALGSLATLMPNGGIFPNRYGHFLMQFTGIGDSTYNGQGYPPPIADVQATGGEFLKLHGSIDWYRCINSSCPNFERLFPQQVSRSLGPYCARCLERTDLTLVPPTMDKRLRSIPVVRRLWNTANHVLARADSLVIWGYSAPPTDFYTTWLLTNAFRGSLTHLTIINPSIVEPDADGASTIDESFVRRISPQIGQAANSITLRLFRTFAEFANNQEVDAIDSHLAPNANELREFFRTHAQARPKRVKAAVSRRVAR